MLFVQVFGIISSAKLQLIVVQKQKETLTLSLVDFKFQLNIKVLPLTCFILHFNETELLESWMLFFEK